MGTFTDAEKTDLRRFCGYPAYGGTPSGFQSWRFFQVFGLVEYRLNNMSTAEEAVMRTNYLANLYTLESAIPSSAGNLDTDEAAAWTHNKNEVADRRKLFDYWRGELCNFLGIPPGPGLGGGNGGMRIVI